MNKLFQEKDELYDKMVDSMRRTSIECSTECLSPTAKQWVSHDSGVGGDQSLPFNDSINNSMYVNSSEIDEPKSTGYQIQPANNSKEGVLEIAGTVIHLSSTEILGSGDDDDEEDFNNMDFDPNATYSIKTMNSKKLAAFLQIVNDSEDDISDHKIRDLQNPCSSLPTQQRQSMPNSKERPPVAGNGHLASERSRRH